MKGSPNPPAPHISYKGDHRPDKVERRQDPLGSIWHDPGKTARRQDPLGSLWPYCRGVVKDFPWNLAVLPSCRGCGHRFGMWSNTFHRILPSCKTERRQDHLGSIGHDPGNLPKCGQILSIESCRLAILPGVWS